MAWGVIAASVVGGMLASNSASSAASTQAGAANAATAAQERMFDKQTQLQAPFRDAGLTANNKLMYLLGLGGANPGQMSDAPNAQDGYGSLMKSFSLNDFQADPGYQWRLDQGQKALDRARAARGGFMSGAAVKEAMDYGQNQASQEYGNAYQRFNADQTNKYNRLAGVVNTGQGATNVLTNAAGNVSNNTANIITSNGNAQGAAQIASGNAWGNAFNQIGNNYTQNQLWSRYLNGGNNIGFTAGAGDAYR